MKVEPEVKQETIEAMAHGIGMNGLGYWLSNYAKPLNDGTDLDNALKVAIKAVGEFEKLLEEYMRNCDVEYS